MCPALKNTNKLHGVWYEQPAWTCRLNIGTRTELQPAAQHTVLSHTNSSTYMHCGAPQSNRLSTFSRVLTGCSEATYLWFPVSCFSRSVVSALHHEPVRPALLLHCCRDMAEPSVITTSNCSHCDSLSVTHYLLQNMLLLQTPRWKKLLVSMNHHKMKLDFNHQRTGTLWHRHEIETPGVQTTPWNLALYREVGCSISPSPTQKTGRVTCVDFQPHTQEFLLNLKTKQE